MLRLDINIWVHLLHLCLLRLPNKYYSAGFPINSTPWVGSCSWSWGLFLESPNNFSSPKSCFFVCVCIQDQGTNNFENDIIKVSVNKAKLTGLWARNCATIQPVLVLKFAFTPEKYPGLLRNESMVLFLTFIIKLDTTLQSCQTVKHTPIDSTNEAIMVFQRWIR